MRVAGALPLAARIAVVSALRLVAVASYLVAALSATWAARLARA
jgi:hypothetical protein